MHWQRPYNTWAIVSASFAASIILGSWFLGGIVAVVTGHVARHQIKQSGEAGGTMALVGPIAGYVSIALTAILVTLYIGFFIFLIGYISTHPEASPTP